MKWLRLRAAQIWDKYFGAMLLYAVLSAIGFFAGLNLFTIVGILAILGFLLPFLLTAIDDSYRTFFALHCHDHNIPPPTGSPWWQETLSQFVVVAWVAVGVMLGAAVVVSLFVWLWRCWSN